MCTYLWIFSPEDGSSMFQNVSYLRPSLHGAKTPNNNDSHLSHVYSKAKGTNIKCTTLLVRDVVPNKVLASLHDHVILTLSYLSFYRVSTDKCLPHTTWWLCSAVHLLYASKETRNNNIKWDIQALCYQLKPVSHKLYEAKCHFCHTINDVLPVSHCDGRRW
jgi:hypothetical protein